ncbi:MAG TPA: archaellin/type IV pilin N-terminal domain-containing protein [Candidatus Bathyarchaeia archaeon]|jgi:flagellin-like protein|nr:archaellin/type IV pilin N-terminal domain-containing protein [Candidatus Bathyarchaeia archaeon]
MHTRKLLKSRKAISPILATLLLIVIAVAAIVVTYAWIMTYMSNAGQQAGVILYKSNVNFYTQGVTKRIDIDVGNSGTSDTSIQKIYCGTTTGSLTEQTPTQSLPISLSKGSISTITINYNWTAGTTYYFKVVATTGQVLGEWPEQA